MSVQTALNFLHAMRESESIRSRLGDFADYHGLVTIAEASGFACSEDDIAEAFRLEYMFRCAHLSAK